LIGVRPRLALLGAQDPLGEAVIALLEERELELAELIPLALDDSEDVISYAGDDLMPESAEGFDWSRADVLVVAARGPAARRQAEAAARLGLPVICLEAEPGLGADTLHRVDSGLAVAAARALGAVARHAGLASVDIFAALPVSMAGKSGVEELARQTQSVFAMEDVDSETFPVRIAFNLIPQVGLPLEDGANELERCAIADLRAALGMPGLPLLLTASWVPTFYGCALTIHGMTRQDMTRSQLRTCLEGVDDLILMDETVTGGAPTPATESQESETVFAGRLRVDQADGRHFALWLVCDANRLEAAQIVDRIENMIEKKAK